MNRLQTLDWHALIARSAGVRRVALLMPVLMLIALGWFVSVRGTQNDHRLVVDLGREALQAQAERRAQVAGLEVERSALLDARLALQEARWRLDAGEGMSELLDQLAVSGHEHGLLFEGIEVLQAPHVALGYQRVPLAISVVGTYSAVRGWLEQWLQQLRLLQATQFSLAGVSDSPGMVRAQLRVLVYQTGEVLPAPASLADEPARPAFVGVAIDPFQAWPDRPAAAGLGRMPLEQLKMVGSLSRGGRFQALVSAAGRLYRVREGQRLGRDEGVVVRIDERRMEVRERFYIAGGWQQRSRFLALGKGALEEGGRDEVEADDIHDAADERQAGTGAAGSG